MSKVLKIKQICTVIAGQSLREGVDPIPDGQYPILQFKNIQNHRINYSEIEKINLPKSSEPKLLKADDVVLYTKFFRSNLPASVCIDRPIHNLIAAPGFFILKTTSELIRPEFLRWYLSSKSHGGKYFLSMATGTSLLNVTKTILEEMDIVVPPIEVQNKFIELYKCTIKEQEIINKIAIKRDVILEAISKKWGESYGR